MLGRTARFLRIFGYNTLYSSSYSDPELIEIASEEDRVLLTRDVELHHQAVKRNVSSFLVKEKTHVDRIAGIILRGNLDLKMDPAHSRCASCNAEITPISKEEVKDKVPLGTFSRFDEYWICNNIKCGKIYYQGPHWIKITEVYEQIREKITEKK